jgi:large subunit ribosomal protein L10
MATLLRRQYRRTKPYPQDKSRIIEEMKNYLSRYSVVLIADLHGLPNRVLQDYKFRLRRRGAVVRKIKNNLAAIALSQTYGDLPEEVANLLTGENLFIFTNENPFELARWIEENGVRREPRAGDVAPYDIVVPAGNTGMSPGPIMSKFGKLKIPIRVQENKIWIVKDTVVVKGGDKINDDVAEILKKLNIRPIYESLRLKATLIRGRRVLYAEELRINIDAYVEELRRAVKEGMNLAINAVYPAPEVLALSLARAHVEAINLAVNAGIMVPESLELMLRKAVLAASSITRQLSAKGIQL